VHSVSILFAPLAATIILCAETHGDSVIVKITIPLRKSAT